MFEKFKEQRMVSKDLQKRHEILDSLGREIIDKNLEVSNLNEEIASLTSDKASLEEEIKRLTEKLRSLKKLDEIEKKKAELEEMSQVVGGYPRLKMEVERLENEKNYLNKKEYPVEDLIFASFRIGKSDEIHFAPFVGVSIYRDRIDDSIFKIIQFKEVSGIHEMLFIPYKGESVTITDNRADATLISYVSYSEVCTALGIEVNGSLTNTEVMNIAREFGKHLSNDSNLVNGLNSIRLSEEGVKRG